ncbi:Lrp/AsnC family transcriptional regulator [Eikenella sp. S3360]|uniref:Lrp/AsnC family transcriptional regulator n=1 Tax=Eikenella glucosivorans TaxID=2766967 RepID=A0ABS0N9I8_9NEIS|nr:Lrp/AsnC family transcriptional regulator [Eikenella glucosivorans]MBH5328972.1 Lrp/AsnC family transcriptional regulator [Eikenella glucosivorans]
MDRIDKKILACLQENGRISLTDLAEKAGISLSPCQRRVRLLEQDGVIRGYQACLAPQKLGLGFAAIVFVSLKSGDNRNIVLFEQAIADMPEITQAQRLFGDPDYMLHIVSEDLAAFQLFYDQYLTHLPNVARLSSTLVMKNVVERGLPIR